MAWFTGVWHSQSYFVWQVITLSNLMIRQIKKYALGNGVKPVSILSLTLQYDGTDIVYTIPSIQ